MISESKNMVEPEKTVIGMNEPTTNLIEPPKETKKETVIVIIIAATIANIVGRKK
jgi:hypothetical protein